MVGNYTDINHEQRLHVTRAIAQMSDEEVKKLKQYMLTCRLADAKIVEFLAQGGAGASTSSAPQVPIPEVMPNPEENNPIYRALDSLLTHRKEGLADPFVVTTLSLVPR